MVPAIFSCVAGGSSKGIGNSNNLLFNATNRIRGVISDMSNLVHRRGHTSEPADKKRETGQY